MVILDCLNCIYRITLFNNVKPITVIYFTHESIYCL